VRAGLAMIKSKLHARTGPASAGPIVGTVAVVELVGLPKSQRTEQHNMQK